MSLATLGLAITLILWGLSLLTWVSVSSTVIGAFALVTGILFLLEGLAVFSYSFPARRRD
jgi:uncharacterized membrane protein HdeD (DUF308 family)